MSKLKRIKSLFRTKKNKQTMKMFVIYSRLIIVRGFSNEINNLKVIKCNDNNKGCFNKGVNRY